MKKLRHNSDVFSDFVMTTLNGHFYIWQYKANLRDLIAATSLVILLKIGFKSSIFLVHVTFKFDGWPRKTIGHLFCTTSGFPQTSLEKFQWFFNDASRQKSQISMIILNVTKRQNTGPHVTHDLLTHPMTTIGCFFFRKYVKSPYSIWWLIYQ